MRSSAALIIQWAGVLTIGISISTSLGAKEWEKSRSDAEQERLNRLVEVLSHLPAGQDLLTRAQRFWGFTRKQQLKNYLRWGTVSRTDAILTRHFVPSTGKEIRERKVSIQLKLDQSFHDSLLDLSHELVHATARPAWDPYDPTLTAGKYILATIEGEGGEVDAVEFECRTEIELHQRYSLSSGTLARCKKYLSVTTGESSPSLEREKIKRDFYRVGRWFEEFKKQAGTERVLFPLLTIEETQLYSSTGNAPYPVALYREFRDLNQIACENSRRRIQSAVKRSPSSEPEPERDEETRRFLEQRCSIDLASRTDS